MKAVRFISLDTAVFQLHHFFVTLSYYKYFKSVVRDESLQRCSPNNPDGGTEFQCTSSCPNTLQLSPSHPTSSISNDNTGMNIQSVPFLPKIQIKEPLTTAVVNNRLECFCLL